MPCRAQVPANHSAPIADRLPGQPRNEPRASYRGVTGSLKPWVRDDLPSATVVVCAGRAVSPPSGHPSSACGSANGISRPRPAKSPKWFHERVIEHTRSRCGVPDHAVVSHCSTSLGYELGYRGSLRRPVPRSRKRAAQTSVCPGTYSTVKPLSAQERRRSWSGSGKSAQYPVVRL